MKNHGLSKNVMFLLYSNCTMCERWLIFHLCLFSSVCSLIECNLLVLLFIIRFACCSFLPSYKIKLLKYIQQAGLQRSLDDFLWFLVELVARNTNVIQRCLNLHHARKKKRVGLYVTSLWFSLKGPMFILI